MFGKIIIPRIFWFVNKKNLKLILCHKNVDKCKKVVYNNSMEAKKHFIDAVLEKEKHRNENMRLAYEKRILDLPRGSLVIRDLNGRKYCYLRYRDGKKVIQKYAGTIEQEKVIREKISERKRLIGMLEMLNDERERILKMEAVK